MKTKTYVISLGGSIVAPAKGIDTEFLKKFKKLILKQIKKGNRFFLVVGGGNTARRYVGAMKKMGKIEQDKLDWLGIYATRLNAYLINTLFANYSYPEIIKDPTINIKTSKKIIVGSGWKPGWSTDYVATKLAEKHKAKTVINLSNIDYAYDKDPSKYKTAKKLESVSWKDFRKIVGNVWKPSLSAPFDPIASRLAQKLKLTVLIANGKNLKNLENFFNNKKTKGTIVQ